MAKVTNRSGGTCVYNIPERHVRRVFQPHETKEIEIDELTDVVSQPGGKELFYHYLMIEDNAVVRKVLNLTPQPEYELTEEQIPTWLVECSLDEFKDALDFAPEGVKDLIKTYAVKLPLNDLNKTNAIKEVLGFDVIAAINNNAESEADNKSTTSTARRTTASTIKKTAPAPVVEEEKKA